MSRTKPMLALGFLGAGIAVFSLALYLGSERFAFTTQTPENLMPELVRIVPPARPLATVQVPPEEPTLAVPTVRLEELPVMPKPRMHKPAARPESAPAAPAAVEPTSVDRAPCNWGWRLLESGPEGRRVREICPTPPPKPEVPRS